jgi:hypothetical protein
VLAVNVTQARVFAAGRLLDTRLEDGHIQLLDQTLCINCETCVSADLTLRTSAQIGSHWQLTICAAIGILPAMLAFLVSPRAEREETAKAKEEPKASIGVIADPRFEMDELISQSRDVTILSNWLPQWASVGSFARVLQRGGRLTLIFQHKDSPWLTVRNKDMNMPSGEAVSKLTSGLTDLYNELTRASGGETSPQVAMTRVTVKTAKTGPLSTLIIKCDGVYYFGPYLRGTKVGDSFMIRATDQRVIDRLEAEILEYEGEAELYDLMRNPWSGPYVPATEQIDISPTRNFVD